VDIWKCLICEIYSELPEKCQLCRSQIQRVENMFQIDMKELITQKPQGFLFEERRKVNMRVKLAKTNFDLIVYKGSLLDA
jgi:hypothetical protein